MSRAPRQRDPRTRRDGDWSAVRVTVDDQGVTYRVLWSAEYCVYLGLCDSYPRLSWQAENVDDALDGIRRQVQERA